MSVKKEKKKYYVIFGVISFLLLSIIFSLFLIQRDGGENEQQTIEKIEIAQKYKTFIEGQINDDYILRTPSIQYMNLDKNKDFYSEILTIIENDENYQIYKNSGEYTVLFYKSDSGKYELPSIAINSFVEVNFNNNKYWLYITEDKKLYVSEEGFKNIREISVEGSSFEYILGYGDYLWVKVFDNEYGWTISKINLDNFFNKVKFLDIFNNNKIFEKDEEFPIGSSYVCEEEICISAQKTTKSSFYFLSDNLFLIKFSHNEGSNFFVWDLENDEIKFIKQTGLESGFVSCTENRCVVYDFKGESLSIVVDTSDIKEVILSESSILGIEDMRKNISILGGYPPIGYNTEGYGEDKILYSENNEIGLWNMGEKVPLYKLDE